MDGRPNRTNKASPTRVLLVLVSAFLRACLQGGRVSLASGLALAGGQKIAWVYKQNFTGRVTLQPGTT